MPPGARWPAPDATSEKKRDDTMTNRTAALGRSLAAVIVVVALGVSCSSSENASSTSPEGGGDPTTTTTTTAAASAPVTSAPRQSCAANTLGAAAVASFEAPALLDVVCENQHAVATLTNGPGGELVLLFALQNGVWVLVGNAPLADAATAAPAGFSTTAVPGWQRARDARLNRGDRSAGGGDRVITDIPPSSLQVNPETGENEICTELSSDYIVCSPPTTVPPPPDDPDAPPVTIDQSGFCKYNYNDPRCVADPGFQP